jgi:hypothetical protein
VSRAEWENLLQSYRAAIADLDSAVRRSRRLVGKEFQEEHQRIEDAKHACEKARRALTDYLGRDE